MNLCGGKILCAGTILNPVSSKASLLTAGTTLSAMKHILDGSVKIAYALVRPPGHHAQPSRADGYCFLNNAGLAIQLTPIIITGMGQLKGSTDLIMNLQHLFLWIMVHLIHRTAQLMSDKRSKV
ncbi:Histone deacetylase [Thalictrum thalictroides]|uniref:Histone deacetylase n=1 Tax=Thalictrum thalictroides TaxID=46969 RepID=A0A7J6WCV4_THATH|nr:Histone deacetylase [Thalictrum thalictroides]